MNVTDYNQHTLFLSMSWQLAEDSPEPLKSYMQEIILRLREDMYVKSRCHQKETQKLHPGESFAVPEGSDFLD